MNIMYYLVWFFEGDKAYHIKKRDRGKKGIFFR